ncbi:MAG: HIT domain-containing protein [Acidobacteria bacterium]|nr:HIT domain-containing protein [Acidobacteriota bacterium]
MDYLWTPWRFNYITQVDQAPNCVFCEKLADADDQRQFIVYRGGKNFVVLNIYPYTVGHLMVVPYRHIATLEEGEPEELAEMMDLTRRAEGALRRVYRPQGLNVGMNIGKSAGAGVASHIHMHVLPRWQADANFMSVVGETRVLPEELPVTWAKLRKEFGP